MVDQYKKTFLGVQVLSFGAAAWVYFGVTHSLAAAGLIFTVMQVGGVLGAAWGSSLRRRMIARNPLLR